jgi:hypothetical protein
MSSSPSFTDVLRLPPGPVDLRSIETDAAPGYDGDKKSGKADLWATGEELFDLQQRLFAGKDDGQRVGPAGAPGHGHLGQGRHAQHTVGLVDPQGVQITSFKAPTRRSCATTSSGGSARRFPARGSSASSTARTTRTC